MRKLQEFEAIARATVRADETPPSALRMVESVSIFAATGRTRSVPIA
jgi:hypothetical protein